MGDALVEGMKVFTGITGPANARINLAGSYRADDPEGLNRLCAFTNRYGNAAVEIFNSNGGIADIIADYVDEGLLRDIKVNFNVPGSSSQTPSISSPQTPTAHKPAFTLGTVRLMTGKTGRYLVVRVNSKKSQRRDPRPPHRQGRAPAEGEDDHHPHEPSRQGQHPHAEGAEGDEEGLRARAARPLAALPDRVAGVRPSRGGRRSRTQHAMLPRHHLRRRTPAAISARTELPVPVTGTTGPVRARPAPHAARRCRVPPAGTRGMAPSAAVPGSRTAACGGRGRRRAHAGWPAPPGLPASTDLEVPGTKEDIAAAVRARERVSMSSTCLALEDSGARQPVGTVGVRQTPRP